MLISHYTQANDSSYKPKSCQLNYPKLCFVQDCPVYLKMLQNKEYFFLLRNFDKNIFLSIFIEK